MNPRRRHFLQLIPLLGGTALVGTTGRARAATSPRLPLDRKFFCVAIGPITGAASTITDYSGFHYCPPADALLFFGGGHAATPEDVVLRFPIDALQWSADYVA